MHGRDGPRRIDPGLCWYLCGLVHEHHAAARERGRHEHFVRVRQHGPTSHDRRFLRAQLMAAPKLGSGKRFAKLEKSLSKEKGIEDPGALAASIGRKKYGKKKFAKIAASG